MNDKKKILHVAESMGGGVFTYIVDLCNKLCDDYEVYVAYGVREQTPDDIESYFDSRVHLIRVKNFTRKINVKKELGAIFEVRKIFKSIKPDILHLHSSKAGVIGRLFIGNRCKKFYTPHGYSFLMKDTCAPIKCMYHTAEWIAGKAKCTTIACGPGEYTETLKLTKRAECISNGIDIQSVDKDVAKIKENIELQTEGKHRFSVVTLGRICEQKNPQLFNQIAYAMPDIDFIWIGDGQLAGQLQAPNIKMTGWLDRGQAISEMMKSDVFILTSLWEGLPISLLEAMYLERVCVVSNVIGNKDVITHNHNGYICNNIKEYVDAIIKIKEGSENSRLTTNAKKDIIEKYNSELIVKKYIRNYEK